MDKIIEQLKATLEGKVKPKDFTDTSINYGRVQLREKGMTIDDKTREVSHNQYTELLHKTINYLHDVNLIEAVNEIIHDGLTDDILEKLEKESNKEPKMKLLSNTITPLTKEMLDAVNLKIRAKTFSTIEELNEYIKCKTVNIININSLPNAYELIYTMKVL